MMTNTFAQPSIDEVNIIIREQFAIDPKDTVIGFELLIRGADPDAYDTLRAEFDSSLKGHLNEHFLRRRTYFGPHYAVFLETFYPRSEIEGLSEESSFYYPVCTKEEIKRIEQPASAPDYLLKVRADEIADSARLNRVFLRRRERAGKNWSLTSYFDNRPFKEYLLSLSDEKKMQCEPIAAGFAFLLEPNGACIRSPYGNVIVISETLKEYLFFMNLFLMTQDGSIPTEDTASALYIAIRIMMLTETPDFDLDPRGVPPEPLNKHCNSLTFEQLQFVIGHEYAHHLLGHLGPRGTLISGHNILAGERGRNEAIYSRSQQQELDADLAALLDPELSDEQLAFRLNAASIFFLGLDLWHTVRDFVAPPTGPSTHPSARDRLLILRNNVLSVRNIDFENIGTDEMIRNNFDHLDNLKFALRNKILPLEIEKMEKYGSIYLNSYRPKMLRDRIDF